MGRTPLPPEQRFKNRLMYWKDAQGNEHLVWPGATFHNGYGAFQAGSSRETTKVVRAHRYAWELVNGPIPDGLQVLHHCDIPTCVMIEHLYLGTDTDNKKDMWDRGLLKRDTDGTFKAPPPDDFLKRVPRL